VGVVVAFEVGGEIVGTTRFVPFGHGLTTIEALLPGLGVSDSMRENAGEVGRLVIAPGYRAGAETLRRSLLLGLLHSMKRYPIANLYATCAPPLCRLYRRFGYSVIAPDACHGPDGVYSLIHGRATEVLTMLAVTETEAAMVSPHLKAVQA
jgi:hypothetical protein